MLRVNNLTKYYGTTRGIENLTMTVEAGTIAGLVGPNGAGKTTLIRAVLSLIHPDSGTVTLTGKPIDQVRGRVGYCGDVYTDISSHRLFSYVGRLRGDPRIPRTAESWAERFHLDTHKTIRKLSQGNLRKVLIILSFATGRPFVVLDEPTNGLDPLMQREFFAFLAERRAEGTTILLSSHQLYDIERACDEIFFIRSGGVFRRLTLAELRGLVTTDISFRSSSPPPLGDKLRHVGHDEYLCRTNTPIADLETILHASENVSELEVRKTTLEQFFFDHYGEGS